MIDFTHVHDRKLAVILFEDDGTEDGKWIVSSGVAEWREGSLSVDRGVGVPEFPIPNDTLGRVKTFGPDVLEIPQESDFYTILSVGPLPEDADRSEFQYTGLTLPMDGDGSEHE